MPAGPLTSLLPPLEAPALPPARLLWEAGGLWSLMTHQALRQAGLTAAPITAAEAAGQGLKGAELLVVPGGWSALKKAALGKAGARAIRSFLQAGGSYLGLCGGAGLALSVRDGLGLVPLGRASGPSRLPALSGPMLVTPAANVRDHPLWRGQASPAQFQVWWPAQFAHPRDPSLQVIARYLGPAPGLYTQGLRVDQVDPADWPELEASHGFRLNPAALAGQAAVLQARLGRGRLLLSYLHLDTPADVPGTRALVNLWQDWLGKEPEPVSALKKPENETAQRARALAAQAQGLWQQGRELGLWQERDQALPLWQRGARGLEMWSLARLTGALAGICGSGQLANQVMEALEGAMEPIWQQGPSVLAAQAEQLAGKEPASGPHEAWFPAPRRSGGALAKALAALELGLLILLRAGERDN